VRNPIVWEFLVDEDEYRKALPGQRYWNKRLLDLCNKIWSFHDELENTAEILSLGSKEVKSRASECYSARA
jgi:hypothetical protein